jgi:hypothetical protein
VCSLHKGLLKQSGLRRKIWSQDDGGGLETGDRLSTQSATAGTGIFQPSAICHLSSVRYARVRRPTRHALAMRADRPEGVRHAANHNENQASSGRGLPGDG